jgi:hypothetical protein
MQNRIEAYYQEAGVNPLLLRNKLAKLERHPDIAVEFCEWLDTHKFREENCVVVEGYTAGKLSQLSTFLCGEGSFMLLIELRENPEKAKTRISEGFFLK